MLMLYGAGTVLYRSSVSDKFHNQSTDCSVWKQYWYFWKVIVLFKNSEYTYIDVFRFQSRIEYAYHTWVDRANRNGM